MARHGLVFAVVLALLAYASGVDVRESSVTELAEGAKGRAGVRGALLVQGQAGEGLDASLALGEGSALSSKLVSRNSLNAAVGVALQRGRKKKNTPPTLTAEPCPEGQQMFGCMPCPNLCGTLAGSSMCTRICQPGCGCPIGEWTGENGACFKKQDACTPQRT